MALPGKGSAVLQCGYPRKPDDPPAHCSVAAPDGREGRRSSHYVRRPYGSSAAAGIFKAAGGDCGKRPDHGSG